MKYINFQQKKMVNGKCRELFKKNQIAFETDYSALKICHGMLFDLKNMSRISS
jgi:hypothetical protein